MRLTTIRTPDKAPTAIATASKYIDIIVSIKVTKTVKIPSRITFIGNRRACFEQHTNMKNEIIPTTHTDQKRPLLCLISTGIFSLSIEQTSIKVFRNVHA